MNERNSCIRTIVRGRVKVHGHYYTPKAAYDGRLDGLRYAFCRYRQQGDSYLPLLFLWGTQAAFHDENINANEGPHIVDGYLPWCFWERVPSEEGERP